MAGPHQGSLALFDWLDKPESVSEWPVKIFRADSVSDGKGAEAIRAVGTDHVHELTSRPKRFPCVVPVDELLTIDSILNSDASGTEVRNFCGRGGPPPWASVRSE